MPFVIAHIARGRPLDKRRRLAAAITAAVSEIFELDPAQTQVLIQEHDRDSWAIGGELLSERVTTRKSDDLPDLDSLFRKLPERPTAKAPAKSAQKRKAKPRSRR
ncbi:MAG: 4-oxalocrotonate tautomerase family protein [Alphaproteobacteria bacterium]|nr:4-oxalocrotonate tautomerase family protein [Alphaproteobacteria bacterium]MBL6936547.1 4-oxalocrotonate tautomerase family protein [Alphaproteobacteria bacterium]MBL7098402.1 4-oxalocrotonate tautomerase family protein [Alphaproteobacteria bacterium]